MYANLPLSPTSCIGCYVPRGLCDNFGGGEGLRNDDAARLDMVRAQDDFQARIVAGRWLAEIIQLGSSLSSVMIDDMISLRTWRIIPRIPDPTEASFPLQRVGIMSFFKEKWISLGQLSIFLFYFIPCKSPHWTILQVVSLVKYFEPWDCVVRWLYYHKCRAVPINSYSCISVHRPSHHAVPEKAQRDGTCLSELPNSTTSVGLRHSLGHFSIRA